MSVFFDAVMREKGCFQTLYPFVSVPFDLSSFYLVYLVRKRCSMTATCARVALPVGFSVVAVVPVM